MRCRSRLGEAELRCILMDWESHGRLGKKIDTTKFTLGQKAGISFVVNYVHHVGRLRS